MRKLILYKKIYANIYGGLGNQIFQMYYSQLLSQKYGSNIFINDSHLNSYKRKFKNEVKFLYSDKNCKLSFSRLSILKIILYRFRILYLISKLKRNDFILHIPFIGIFIDSYCQSESIFRRFNILEHKRALNYLIQKSQLINNKYYFEYKDKTLLHLRVSDFFNSELEREEYIYSQLKNYKNNTESIDIITDKESLLKKIIKMKFKREKFNLISTNNFPAKKLFSFMSQYREIITNGSSIAFWASVVSSNNKSFISRKYNLSYNYLYQNFKKIINSES